MSLPWNGGEGKTIYRAWSQWRESDPCVHSRRTNGPGAFLGHPIVVSPEITAEKPSWSRRRELHPRGWVERPVNCCCSTPTRSREGGIGWNRTNSLPFNKRPLAPAQLRSQVPPGCPGGSGPQAAPSRRARSALRASEVGNEHPGRGPLDRDDVRGCKPAEAKLGARTSIVSVSRTDHARVRRDAGLLRTWRS